MPVIRLTPESLRFELRASKTVIRQLFERCGGTEWDRLRRRIAEFTDAIQKGSELEEAFHTFTTADRLKMQASRLVKLAEDVRSCHEKCARS